MSSRSASASKKATRQGQKPYDRKVSPKSRPASSSEAEPERGNEVATTTSGSGTVPEPQPPTTVPLLPTASGTSSVSPTGQLVSAALPVDTKPTFNFRSQYIRTAQRNYPFLVPENDCELMQLVNGAYRPEPQPNPDSESSQVQAQEAFHVWAEKQMEMEMPLWALGQTAAMNSEEVRKTMMDHMRVMVDSVEIIGFKPDGDGSGSADADTDVVFIPIPNNKYTIRMWVHKHGHGAPWERFFTLDFFDTATNMPVNSPFKQYALWGDNVLWHSLRPAYIADKSVVPPGRENFIVKEGANIKFARPGKMDIVFQARIPNVPATADEGTEAAKGNITGNDGVAKEEEAEWDEAWERIWNPRPNAVYSDEDDEDDDEGAEEDEYEDALMEEMEYVYQQAREILGPGEKLSKEDKAMLLEETRQNFQEEGKRQRRIEKYEST